MELIVRNGNWFVANGGKPAFQKLKKNDIVFNAAQTKALLEHGKTSSYGKFIGALNGGTAFASGSKNATDYTHYPAWYRKQLTKKVKGDQYGTTKLEDKTGLDWIERIFKKLDNAVSRFAKVADNAGKTFAKRIKNIEYEITDYKKISKQSQAAATRYLNEANRLGLDKKYVDRIQNGKIDQQWVASQTGSDKNKKSNPLLAKISEYIELYDKSQEMLERQLEAESKIAELYQERFELIQKKFESWIEHNVDHTITMLEETLSRQQNGHSYLYSTNSSGQSRADRMSSTYNAMIEAEQARQKKLLEERKALQAAMDRATKNGIDKTSDAWNNMQAALDDVNEKISESRTQITEYQQDLIDLAVDLFDEIAEKWEYKIGRIEHRGNLLQTYMEQAEANGDATSSNYYDALLAIEQERRNSIESEIKELNERLIQGLTDQTIVQGDKNWRNMVETIQELNEELADSELTTIEYNNAIRQLKWDAFDKLQNRIAYINEEADFLIDLLENKKLIDDNGNMTSEGEAVQGLHAVNYNTYMESANRYRDAIAELDEEFKDDNLDASYVERREQLVAAQREAILSAEDEKQAMIDLIKDGYEAQADAMDDLIDKYMDALDSAKDLYDFQKKTAKQTKEIARLEKQLAALRGDNSEEARQKIQKIQVSLEEARSDLEDSQYDRYISEHKELFSDLQESFSDAIHDAIDNAADNISDTIKDVLADVEANRSSIYSTIKDEIKDVGANLSNRMIRIWTEDSPMLEYYDRATEANTSIVNALNRIESSMASNAQRLDNEAQSAIDSTNLKTQTIKVDKEFVVDEGGKVKLNAKAKTPLHYRSADTSVATVTDSGTVKGVKGTTSGKKVKITIRADATAEYKSAEATVTVKVMKKQAPVAPKPDTSTDTEKKPDPKPETDKKPTTDDKKPTSTSTQGDGKIQVGDKVTFKSGKYYGTSSGSGGSGNSNLGKKVYITKKSKGAAYPYHLSTSKTFGKGDLGWVKKSQIEGFATGGIIGDLQRAAKLNGDDTVAINTFKKGEAVLTPEQAVQFKKLLDFMPNLIDFSQAIDLAQTGAHQFAGKSGISMGDNNIEVNIAIDHVDDYNDFVYKLQRDPKFEKMVQSMSIDRAVGRANSMSKFQQRFR